MYLLAIFFATLIFIEPAVPNSFVFLNPCLPLSEVLYNQACSLLQAHKHKDKDPRLFVIKQEVFSPFLCRKKIVSSGGHSFVFSIPSNKICYTLGIWIRKGACPY